MINIDYYDKDEKIRTGRLITITDYGYQVMTSDGQVITIKKENIRGASNEKDWPKIDHLAEN